MDWKNIILGGKNDTQTTTQEGSSTPLLLFAGFTLVAIVAVLFFALKK